MLYGYIYTPSLILLNSLTKLMLLLILELKEFKIISDGVNAILINKKCLNEERSRFLEKRNIVWNICGGHDGL